jgi:nickel transport protein
MTCFQRILAILAIVLPTLAGPSASAHILKVFAEVSGDMIVGEGYFSSGGVPSEQQVEIFGPSKQKIGEVTTDDKGKFKFKPTKRQNHTFVIDAGEGHRAEWVVEADELPASLPSN